MLVKLLYVGISFGNDIDVCFVMDVCMYLLFCFVQ